MLNKKILNLSIISIIFIFSGCTNLIENKLVIPENIDENKDFINNNINDIKIDNKEWWKDYNDNNLNYLIENMLSENFDIKNSKEQININLNQKSILNSNLFPEINIEDKINIQSDSNSINNFNKTNKLGISISNYEIDYLGKLNKILENQESIIKIDDLTLQMLKLNLSYDITLNYFNIIYLNERINLINEKLITIEETIDINKKLLLYGYSNELILNNLLIEKNKIEIDIKILEQYKNEYEKLLKNTLGIDKQINYSNNININNLNENLIISKQIENRFDIKISENKLKIENANISLAKSQYFPTISLSSFLGLQTIDLFNNSSKFWSISPSIFVNIFDMGKVSINIKQKELKKQQALNNYISTIRNAFLEVKTNYLNYKISKEKNNKYLNIIDISEKNYQIALKEYEIGKISKINLLNYKINLLNNKINFVEIKNDYILKELNLRKSLQGNIK